MRVCHFCKSEISSTYTIGYASECPSCSRPLKICLNCRHYDPHAYHECTEGVEERVHDKDRANFCDYFSMRESGKTTQSTRSDEARSKFNSLFNDE
ncbi:MAG: hypothetical protein ACOX0W_04885 [Sphaerochaetaceae bacterium]